MARAATVPVNAGKDVTIKVPVGTRVIDRAGTGETMGDFHDQTRSASVGREGRLVWG